MTHMKIVMVLLLMAASFVAGVVGANHCPVVMHYSGGPCPELVGCHCRHCPCCPCRPCR